MADSAVREILINLECKNLTDIFQENDIDFETFKLLRESDLQILVASVGKRVKIFNYIQKLNSENKVNSENINVPEIISKNNDKFMTNEVLRNNQDEEVSGSSQNKNIEEEKCDRNQHKNKNIEEEKCDNNQHKNKNIEEEKCDSNQHKNKNEGMLGSTDEKEIVAENTGYRTSLCKRWRHDTDLFNLAKLLHESCTGRGIIKDYEENNILSRKNRNNLVTLIINHFLDKSRVLTNDDIEIIATKISDLFPNETSETYYIPPTKLLSHGNIRVSIARGKLIDKHRNLLRELRKCGLFVKNKNPSKSKKNIDNADCNDSYIWLKNNREPFTAVIEHWNKSYTKREQSQVASVVEFIKDWSILSLPNGYVLIDIDFGHKYPDSVNNIYRHFDNLMDQLLLHHLPKKVVEAVSDVC
ncbi:hypothetical protein ACS0PU_002636 [Formica fusca]